MSGLGFNELINDISDESVKRTRSRIITRCATRALVLFRNLTQIWEAESKRAAAAAAASPLSSQMLVSSRPNEAKPVVVGATRHRNYWETVPRDGLQMISLRNECMRACICTRKIDNECEECTWHPI